MTVLSGFSRLKGIFSGSLNLQTYKDIVSASKNAECGNISKDIIGLLLGKNSTNTIQTDISTVKSVFAEASDKLAHGISVNQRAQAIQIHRALSSSLDKNQIISLGFLKNAKLSNKVLEPTACTRGIDEASKILTDGLSKIIPNCAKVEIKPLKAGSYGQGYKLEFLDANGNKLIHDKVLKVFYKDGRSQIDLFEKTIPILMAKSKEFTAQFTLRDIVTFWNNLKSITVEDIMPLLKPLEKPFAKQGISITPEDVEQILSKLRSTKLKEIKPFLSIFKGISSKSDDLEKGNEMINSIKKHMSQIHGVYAEANTMMFLRNRVGHSLRKTDVVAPDYYDLKKGFSVAEYSDGLLPASTSDVNFELLGLSHTDLHDANKVAGKIIDLGGVNLSVPELSDKITLRYYKKIMNQKNPELRRKYISQLEKEIETMNDLDKEKVRKAINLAA